MESGYRLSSLILAGSLFMLAGCAAPEAPATPTSPVTISPAPSPSHTPTITPPATPTSLPPFFEAWQASAHANPDASAFRFWDDAEPSQIPPACARCHSPAGFLDYLGADGSLPGIVDTPVEPGAGIDCEACHNDATKSLGAVLLPSGAELTGLGSDAVCLLCHQGTASGKTLELATKSLAPNGISQALEFISVHDAPAGAVLYGSEAAGGYEYPSRAYAGRFKHSPGFSACISCHDAHSLSLKADTCGVCHAGIENIQDIQAELRISTVDYDADGVTTEGIALEIETFQVRLLAAIQEYAARAGNPLSYDAGQDPYFFDAAGAVYQAWTPALLKASYNYHFAMIDLGAYSHNPQYIMQLLYDSIQDLGGGVTGLVRP